MTLKVVGSPMASALTVRGTHASLLPAAYNRLLGQVPVKSGFGMFALAGQASVMTQRWRKVLARIAGGKWGLR
jgi:hypothetical protein